MIQAFQLTTKLSLVHSQVDVKLCLQLCSEKTIIYSGQESSVKLAIKLQYYYPTRRKHSQSYARVLEKN